MFLLWRCVLEVLVLTVASCFMVFQSARVLVFLFFKFLSPCVVTSLGGVTSRHNVVRLILSHSDAQARTFGKPFLRGEGGGAFPGVAVCCWRWWDILCAGKVTEALRRTRLTCSRPLAIVDVGGGGV